jgi:hypothetical protein
MALRFVRGAPVWGFTFAMAAPAVDVLTDSIVGFQTAGEIVAIIRQQRAFGNHVDADRGDGSIDEESLDHMMVIALVEAARPA